METMFDEAYVHHTWAANANIPHDPIVDSHHKRWTMIKMNVIILIVTTGEIVTRIRIISEDTHDMHKRI